MNVIDTVSPTFPCWLRWQATSSYGGEHEDRRCFTNPLR